MKNISFALLCFIFPVISFALNTETEQFCASGNDADGVTISLTPDDFSVNGINPITNVSISAMTMGSFCPSWYNATLTVVGGVSDGVSVTGCNADLAGLDVTGFTSLTLISNDVDGWSDSINMCLDLDVSWNNYWSSSSFNDTEQFCASGTDEDGVTISLTPLDFSVNGANTITSASISSMSMGNNCPSWYNATLTVVGGVSDGVTITGCNADMVGLDITGFTSLTLVSNDTDAWADSITMCLDIDVSWDTPTIDSSEEFCASGTDANGVTVSLTPESFSVNLGEPITSITIASMTMGNFCPSWYNATLTVVGGVSDGVTITGCDADMVGLDITGFTSLTLVSNDTDAWSDSITMCLNLNISYLVPQCAAPSDLIVSNISSSSANISWTPGSESNWEYQVLVSGTSPAESGITINTNPFDLTGLNSNTEYDFYVRALCDDGSMSGWVSVSFTTLCDAISTIPFYEGFNSDSTTQACWTVLNENGDTDLWNMDYTSNPFEGNESAVMYTDFNSGSNDDWLISPGIVLTGNERLKFHQRVQSSFEPNNFEVLLSSNGISPTDFTNVLIADADYDNTTYIEYIVDLSAYTGTSYIAFHVPAGGLDGWRLYIDNFIVEPIPSCIAPTDLDATANSFTDATLSWTGDVGAVNYEVVVQTPGSGVPTGAGTVVSETTYNAISLTPETTYEFYVRTDCGSSNGFSVWSGPFEFYMGYCESVPTSNDGQGISSISLNSTSFTSAGDVTYEDFTSPIVDVSQALTADMQITFATGYTYDTNIWIDFNGDLVYDNATELVFDGVSTNANPTTLDASFVIPADTPLGIYNMRIGTADSGQSTPNPCYNGSWGVTADMKINVVEAPSCVPPSGLTAANITGTTADLSWNGDASNISWEYVIVLNGEPAPTGSGTGIGTTNVQATGLDYLTSYDLYVMSLCGNTFGNSNWVGPLTFTTTQQTNFDVDCSLGQAVNVNYCYTNNDSTFWVFTSTNGYPLELTFNAGTIEGSWDDLTVYDGPDNTGTVLFNNNTADVSDLSGIVIESTSTSIYIEVDSDGSTSCESNWSNTYIPWDFDVVCKTCITQSVEFDIVGSCEPIQEFYIETNVTNMGDAVNLQLTDNQGSAVQTATSTGVVTFGPYPANTQVIISVLNSDDNSCSVESGNLTFLCPPPPNECSIVYAGEDTTFCSDNDPATVLTASYHILGQDTTSYEVTVQDNCPTPLLTGGTPTSINTDDVWSEAIDLGFEFCFFGETYSQILIGSNGVLSFELENADSYNEWSLQSWNSTSPDILPNGSNSTLSEGNIFGVGHDIDPSECGEINYMILGTAPARQFVVNYNEVCHFGFSCSDNASTSQIILYESSNVIDINIINKPLCTDWNDGLAVVGIQNIDDTIAFTPADRNTGAWETTNEFWRFSPSIGDANYVLEWYDEDNNIVGTGDTVTVYPEQTTTYTAAVTYNLCSGGTATVTDTVLVEITPTPIPVAVSNDVYICEGEEVILEVNVDASQQSPSLVYYWTYDNIDIQFGPANTLTLPAGSDQYGDYLVTAYNEETGCFADTTITVSPGFVPELEDGTSFMKCANGDVELSVNILNDVDMNNTYNYAWYMNGELLQDSSSPTFIHGEDLSNGIVTVEVTDSTSMCSSTTTIEVAYYMNQNCVDIPQGISPNGDGFNDCLVLDHLEAQEDIIKAEIYNRYGTKVFELNDYVDHWCGQDGNSASSGTLLPVGTYFYVIQYASGREPTISWIYLNY